MALHTPILVLLHIQKKPSSKKELSKELNKSEKAITKAITSLNKMGLIQYNQTDNVYEPKNSKK